MWVRRGRLLALVLACAVLLSACARQGAQQEPGGATKAEPTEFRIAVGIDPDTLDPAATTTTTVANILDYVVETLVRIDKDGNVWPHLAESWEVAPDGLSLTLQLRRGVKFHDGTPFNAEAVVFNLRRILDPEVRVPIRAPYVAIDRAEAVDEYTVKLYLKEPSPALISALSWTTAAMISPKSVEAVGNTYKEYRHPVGTGPYVFKEYVKGDHLTVERFAEYWGEKPYYHRVTFRVVPEAGTRESLLLAGQADLIMLPPAADIPALQQNPDVKVLLAPSNRTIFIAINNKDPILKDKRVRQALNYAVNKEEIIKNVLFGTADLMDAPMAPSLFGYCPIGAYPYDVEKAKTLLAEAGVKDLTLKFVAPTGRYVQDFQAAQAVAGFLEQVGIKTELRTMDWPTYLGTINVPPDKATVQLHLLGWAPAYLDAQQQMLQFQTNYHPPQGLATSYYSNPDVDDLLARASRELDPQVRKDLYCQAARIVWDDAPWIFLWVQRFPIVYSAKITNVSYLPNEKFDAIYARPAE